MGVRERSYECQRCTGCSEFSRFEHVFLRAGRRVRVRGGSLDGLKGILVPSNGSRNLVISLQAIQRSLSIRVDGYELEPI